MSALMPAIGGEAEVPRHICKRRDWPINDIGCDSDPGTWNVGSISIVILQSEFVEVVRTGHWPS